MTLLRVSGLRLAHSLGHSVEPVFDFTIDQGITALMGASGVGKSSLALAIAGIAPAKAGNVILNNHAITQLAPNARHKWGVRYLPQDSKLFPHMTAEENIAFAAGGSGVDLKTIEALALQAHLRKRPHQLSGGQARRVALARAVATRPELLILDEPFTGLDPRSEDLVQQLILASGRDTCPVLLISHDARRVLATAEHAMIMTESGIVEEGPVADLLDGEVASHLLGGPAGGSTLALPVLQRDETGMQLALGPQRLQLAGTNGVKGDSVHIQILSRDVALARAPWPESSIRNQITCTVAALRHTKEHCMVSLTVAETDHALRALITSASAQALRLTPGDTITALIKAVQVRRD